MTKYDLAAIVAVNGLEFDRENFNSVRKFSADEQRRLFGFPVFGRLTVYFDASGQGRAVVMKSTRTDSVSAEYSFEEVSDRINRRERIRLN